ncbi:MAG: hypothetical protein GF350_07605 [Chitinivibrionales bacterium]|nr:hypothetical protein [Chitinivibrionales bacterium]
MVLFLIHKIRGGSMSTQRGFVLVSIVICALISPAFTARNLSMTVNTNDIIGPNKRLWRCTGHKWATSNPIMSHRRQNTAYIAGIPYGSMEYMRMHDILKGVKAEFNADTSVITYDFSGMDTVIAHLRGYNLRPHIELMTGFSPLPVNYSAFASDTVYRRRWYDFICELANHYIGIYGIEEVRRWIFQVDNEESFRRGPGYAIKFMIEEAALHGIDSQIVYGASGQFGVDWEWEAIMGFLHYLYDNPNIYTGERTRIDFLTAHCKMPYWKAARWGIEMTQRINDTFPEYAGKILLNDDESDPVSGHQHDWAWRIGPSYSAMVAARTWAVQTWAIDATPAEYLLNNQDNAFIHNWTGRSLMAIFGHDQDDYCLIKKSSINTYELFSLFGDTRVATGGYAVPPLEESKDIARVDAMATTDDDGRCAIMLFNNREFNISCPEDSCIVDLTVKNLAFDKAMLVHYRIDETHSNAFRVWQEMGGQVDDPLHCTNTSGMAGAEVFDWQGPGTKGCSDNGDCPTPAQIMQMRERMELELYQTPEEVTITGGEFSLQVPLPMPSVSMVVLAPKPSTAPSPPANIQTEEFPNSLTGMRETMITWTESSSRYIRTYEVLFSETENGNYERVNTSDFFTTAFMHARPAGCPDGFYKVRAVDYWGRTSDGQTVAADKNTIRPKSAAQVNGSGIQVRGSVLHCTNTADRTMQVTLYNSLGKVCMTIPVAGAQSTTIDLTGLSLAKGCYWIETSTPHHKQMHKAVIK